MSRNVGLEFWLFLFALLVAVGVLGAQGLLVAFGLMGMLVAGVSWLWNRVALFGVAYERHLDQNRAFVGDVVRLTVTLTNRKPIPLAWVSVSDQVPSGLEFQEAYTVPRPDLKAQDLCHSTAVAWYERVRWRYDVRCVRRGYHRLGPARIESGDLFGFFRTSRVDTTRDAFLVYPRIVPLIDLGIPALRPHGEARGGNPVFQDPSRPSGVREYRGGDAFKWIDWKATAKRHQLLVRTFDPSSSDAVLLVVSADTTPRPWEGYSAVLLERVVTASSSIATHLHERRHVLGLFSNGTPVLSSRPIVVRPSRAPGQLTLVLEALATIPPVVMTPISRFLSDHMRRFPLGATLVMVAALVPSELQEMLLDLKARGHPVVLAYVGDEACPTLPDGVVVHDVAEYFRSAELAGEYGPR